MIFLRLGIKSCAIYIFSIILAAISAVNTNADEQLPSALKATGSWSFKLNGHKAELAAWTIPGPFHFNRAKLQGVLLIDGGKCQMAVNISRTSFSGGSFSDFIKDPAQANQLNALAKVNYYFEKILNRIYYKTNCENYLSENARLSLFVTHDGSLKIAHMPFAEDEITLYLESISDLQRSSASSLMREIVSIETEEHKSFLSKIYFDPSADISRSNKISFPSPDSEVIIFEKSANQSSIHNYNKLYVLKDYQVEIRRRGWWVLKSHVQPNGGYAFEILSLDPNLHLNPKKGLLPEIGGIDWSSLEAGLNLIGSSVIADSALEKRVNAISAFLNWYDSPEKGNSTSAEVAPIINNINGWYLVSDFGVQYINLKRSAMSRSNRLLKVIDMSDTFELGEPTGHMAWDRDKQYIEALPMAKNTVTGVIEGVAEPFHKIYFLYDAAQSERLGTPTYTSSKVIYTSDDICLEYAGKINIETCTKTVSATPMKNRVFTLIEDRDIAVSYYNDLMGKPQNMQNAENSIDKCAGGPFCDQLGHEYLQNIYRGNYSAVRRDDLKTRDQYRETLLRGQLRENPIFKQWVDALVPYSVSNLKLVLDRYLLAYKKFPDSCFAGGRQSIQIAAQTDKIVMVDGFGTPTGESFGGEIVSSVYEVPPHLLPYVNKLGRASSEGSKATLGLINKFVTGADTSNIAEPLETLPEKVDCRSEELATFERNLISFYERVSNEPATQPPGTFVRSYE